MPLNSQHGPPFAPRALSTAKSDPITVLCTCKKSPYNGLDVETYPASRDAYTFAGHNPVIAHPPCRAWGRYHHLSKHTEREKTPQILAEYLVRCLKQRTR